MRYLVAETNWKLIGLSRALAEAGTLVTRCDNGEDLDAFHSMGTHDLAVLDARLLGRDTSLARLRDAHPNVPLCVIARKPDPAQIAAWINAGADTVLAEEMPLPEMTARLHAVARRAHGVASKQLECGPLRLDLETRRVHAGEITLSLSPKLYEILEFLTLRSGRLASRDQLLGHVYGFENEPAPRVFDVYMCNLRSHLAHVAEDLSIETVRGAGYRMRAAGCSRAAELIAA